MILLTNLNKHIKNQQHNLETPKLKNPIEIYKTQKNCENNIDLFSL